MPKPTKVYFDADKVALGTVDNYYGDYYASETFTLDEGFDVKGKTHQEIRNIHMDGVSARVRARIGQPGGLPLRIT